MGTADISSNVSHVNHSLGMGVIKMRKEVDGNPMFQFWYLKEISIQEIEHYVRYRWRKRENGHGLKDRVKMVD